MPPRTAVAALAVACVVTAVASCGRPEVRVEPVPGGSGRGAGGRRTTTEDTSTSTPAATATTTPTTATAPGPPTTTPTAAPGPHGADAAHDRVAAVLARYDLALTRLGAEPGSATGPGSPTAQELAAVLVPGSALADDVAADLLARRDAGTTVRPGAGGLSWVHRPLDVVPAADGTLSFTWCGWSPGVAVDAAGAVVDDGVAVSSGTGVVRTGPDGDRLASLDQLDVTVGPAGTPDPCPAPAAAP